MEKLKIKAVIFDLGSTLIEYETTPWPELSKYCINSVYKYLKKRKFELPSDEQFLNLFEEVKSFYRKTATENLIEWSVPTAAEKVLEKLEIPNENNLADKMFEAYYKPVEAEIYAYDDSFSTLKKIKDKIGTIGLVSNTIFPDQTHIDELKRFDLYQFFDFTIFSSVFGLRKPHSDIFIQAVNMAGFAPSECLYVGDRYIEDITGPNSIGMPAILKVKLGREYPEDMPEETIKIDKLGELANYLDL